MQRERERGFQADDAEGRDGQFNFLVVPAVGGVVRGDGIHGAVRQCLQYRIEIRLGTQGRVHLEVRIELHQLLVREREVVGGHLTRDVQAPGFRFAHHAQGARGAEVRQVQVASRMLRQHDVPGHHGFFRGAGNAQAAQGSAHGALVHVAFSREMFVLLVGDDGNVEPGGVFQRPAHDFGVHHRQTVVAESHAATCLQGSKITEFFALHALGEGSQREVSAEPRGVGLGEHQFGDGHGVVGGPRVGHGADRGKSTGDGGARARFDGFFSCLPRFTEMHVKVNESRREQLAASI